MIVKLKKFISNPRYVWILVAAITIIASLQAIFTGTRALEPGGIEYTRYNNYQIFEQSFFHLIEQKDLYILYLNEHWDLYKYSPTFSALFGVFAVFPDIIGLTLWNLLNAFILVGAIYYLPKFNNFQKGLLTSIVLLELLTSIQSEQSNGLMAGLLVLAFGLLEKKHFFWATFCLAFTVFIKLFGIVGFALLLFYSPKWKLVFYTILNAIILLAVPFLFINFDQYLFLIDSYGKMLANDHSISYGFSLMGIIHTWFGIDFNKLVIVAGGAILFLIPYLRFKLFESYLFKLLALASVLLWVIIFNHKAESPTFVIAMTGVAIWFVSTAQSKLNIGLLVLALVLTSLSPTDLFPKFIRDEFVVPYALKVLPCILIWFKIIYEMLVISPKQEVNINVSKTSDEA
jgi:hypothetical protein